MRWRQSSRTLKRTRKSPSGLLAGNWNGRMVIRSQSAFATTTQPATWTCPMSMNVDDGVECGWSRRTCPKRHLCLLPRSTRRRGSIFVQPCARVRRRSWDACGFIHNSGGCHSISIGRACPRRRNALTLIALPRRATRSAIGVAIVPRRCTISLCASIDSDIAGQPVLAEAFSFMNSSVKISPRGIGSGALSSPCNCTHHTATAMIAATAPCA